MSSLYGSRAPKATASRKDASSATNLSFASHLSSLIASSSSAAAATDDDHRPSKRAKAIKSDIFSSHNRNAHLRAAADLSGTRHVQQLPSTAADAPDEETLRRAQRRMQQKEQLYEQLQRGEYLEESSDEDEDGAKSGNGGDRTREREHARARRAEKHSLVDFDRKWAQAQEEKVNEEADSEDDEAVAAGAAADEPDPNEIIKYIDEFGRTRTGTRADAAAAAAEAAESEQKKQSAANTRTFPLPASARPARPETLIHGPAIQSAAFRAPEALTRLAATKPASRSPTPPPDTHYDASGEVRARGTGFYAFDAADPAARAAQMAALEETREQTRQAREAAWARRGLRKVGVEKRRRKVEELRGARRAEEFLKGVGDVLMG